SLGFATDAVIYLWDFNGRQVACRVPQGRGATVRGARTPVPGRNEGPFCIFGRASPWSLSEFERTSALCAGARRREGWIKTRRAERRSGAIIAAPPWLGRGQA